MAVTNRGSILISTANDIGSSLVDVIGGEGYSPNEWAKDINICGIAAADIPTALDNIEESTPSGTDRGDISLDTANAVGAVLNKKFNTARGFKPSEWASAISKLTELEIKTASGAIASFNDGADDVPIESATFEFSPNQDLNGQDAPYPPGGGKNLFNADDIYAHGFWNVNGSFTNNENYNAYIIKADPETDYTYNAGFTGITTFLDSNGDYISGLNQGTGLSSRTVTTPANCAYITASISITNLNGTQQIEQGSSSTAYAPYANICPIRGYEGLTIYQKGKNFLPCGNADTQTINQVTVAADGKGRYTVSGTATGGAATFYYSFNESYTVSVGDYLHIMNSIGSASCSISIRDSNGNIYSPTMNPANRIVSLSSYVGRTIVGLSIYISNGSSFEGTITPMIIKGNAATSFEPYKSKTPIVDSFGRTVYGGSRKADGTLEELYVLITLDGSQAVLSGNYNVNGYVQYSAEALGIDFDINKLLYCNMYLDTTFGANRINSIEASNIKRIRFNDARLGKTIKSKNDWNAFLASNNVVIACPLITPNEYDLGDINMSTYYGGNNIYSDTNGDTTVSYRADIDLSAT